MRRAERPVADQRHVAGQHAGDGVDARDVQRFGGGHARQDRGEGAREERLAGSRGSGHKNSVTSGRGDFQRSFNMLLILHAYTIMPVAHLLLCGGGVTIRVSMGSV